jgi:chromosome segregation ATPase
MAERESALVRHFPRVLARSAAGAVNLTVAGAGALSAAALHSWPVLALGGVAYAALVAWDLATPGFWRETLSGNSKEEVSARLPDADSLRDARVRDAVRAITAARAQLERTLKEAPESVRSHLELVLSSLHELEGRAARLAVRGEELARFLGQVDPGAVREQLRLAAEQAAGTRDAEARAQYESARAAREEQLSALVDIDAARERVLANLSRIAATYQGLPAKVMRLHALDAQATESMYGDLNEELGRMNGELGAFEETLKSFHEVRVGT